jgi:hypothetical protein
MVELLRSTGEKLYENLLRDVASLREKYQELNQLERLALFETEHMLFAIELSGLSRPSEFLGVGDSHDWEFGSDERLKRLRHCIFREFHLALCTQDPRYQEQIQRLAHGADILVGVIAGYIAKAFGAAEAVIAALCGAIFVLIAKFGVNTFCQYVAEIEKDESAP